MAGSGVDLLFGPMLIGVFFNTILYGTMVVQTYIYFQTYKRDAWWIKAFVLYLLLCETLNTGFDIGMMYEPLIVRYGTPEAVTVAPIMLSADPIMTVLISSPVQYFIAWRLKVMSNSFVLPAIIGFFATTSLIGGIATTISVTIINKYVDFHKFDGAVITWLASSAVADVIITASLVYSLVRQRTGFHATDNMINRLIRLTVQTGLITSVSATLDVTLFLAIKPPRVTVPDSILTSRSNYIWDFALSKLYSNSILSTLNARGGWKSSSSVRENILFGSQVVGEQSYKEVPTSNPHSEFTVELQATSSASSSTIKNSALSQDEPSTTRTIEPHEV
ncbi:hypothetical protein JVU11DRAFT_11706 [Chiua virens]|nr:hypothetical protein JVU11DRAFT_11706 [Chiua virens]